MEEPLRRLWKRIVSEGWICVAESRLALQNGRLGEYSADCVGVDMPALSFSAVDALDEGGRRPKSSHELILHGPAYMIHTRRLLLASKRTRSQPTSRILRIDPVVVRLLRHTFQA